MAFKYILPDRLQPMDILLYGGNSFFDHAIKIKTWGDVCHVETYIGDKKTAASRNGLGVQTYDYSSDNLLHVLRPTVPFDFEKALAWHHSVTGQKYDWKGLLIFTLAIKQGSPDKMFCSEHAHRMAQAGGYFPFGTHYLPDETAPDDFEKTPVYQWLFEEEK